MIEDRKILHLVELFDEAIEEFEDVVIRHPARLARAVDENAPLQTLLGAATTRCIPLGQEIDAHLCMSCDHFISCRRDAGGVVIVKCWGHQRRKRLARGTERFPAVHEN